MIDSLKIFISVIVICGFAAVFGRGFYLTAVFGKDIAEKKRIVDDVERDRKDATRRLDDAKTALAKATNDNRNALEKDVQVRQTTLEELNSKTTQSAEALTASMQVFGENFNYLATALAGLVGTVVATMFGQELEKKKIAPVEGTRAATSATAALLGTLATWRDKLSSIYAIVYISYGVIAIVLWAIMPYSPEMVKSLATIALTLILAIARSFFE